MTNYSHSHFSFPTPPIHHPNDVVSTTTTITTAAITASVPSPPPERHRITTVNTTNPKRKRSKTARTEGAPKHGRRGPDPGAPKITMPCSECGKKFWSWKALFGHMRCHPERQWRGINPPPNLRRSSPHPLWSPNRYVESISVEEYDVASCLLLLASGSPTSSFHDRFECSSCKKVFGSHQALGGHRASHKNVKGCFAIAAKIDGDDEGIDHDDHRDQNDVASEKKMELGSSSSGGGGGHRCGICLKVFASGQALGGHKRCHWEKFGEEDYYCSPLLSPSSNNGGLSSSMNNINGGGLDLNLPPPPADAAASTMEELDYSSSTTVTLDLRLGL
ncbi:zinc finger protein ZAT3 [Humulus lupulus]|uniref:zinc finger protein ZAT3 n=1 Tax=Humulus lupulus TaxID=3486 RepID=UPI002B40D7FB|nr:zinc finger protein ZAT3 [Humulus lupulus]